jgi:hypothetical protein
VEGAGCKYQFDRGLFAKGTAAVWAREGGAGRGDTRPGRRGGALP